MKSVRELGAFLLEVSGYLIVAVVILLGLVAAIGLLGIYGPVWVSSGAN